MLLPVKPVSNHDLTKLFVARQELIERFELTQRIRRNWLTHMLVDKWFEPIPQPARLRRRGIEFTGKSVLPKSVQYVAGCEPGLLDPGEKIFPRVQPLDPGVHRDRSGVQEVQSRVVGYEKRWRALGCHGRFQGKRKISK